jgi:hypothetical protein
MNFNVDKVCRDTGGKVIGIIISGGPCIQTSHPLWNDFLAWNAKQETPLDLSDKPPEPEPVDVDLERIKTIIAKADGDVTAAELKETVLKFLRKRV